jgi:pyruvate formate lyase activating enzyme
MLPIKGFQKTCLIDYPGKVASLIFLPLCTFRCPYCHNPDLINNFNEIETIPEKKIIDFLEKRKGWIDALVISGGEPTLHKEIFDFLKKVKKLDILTKIDTNGTNPVVIKELIDRKLIDFVAMDIKAPLEKYDKITKTKVNKKLIQSSVDIIKNSNIDYEFRITVVPELITKEDLIKIGTWLKGSKKFCIQQFNSKNKLLDPKFENKPSYSAQELEEFKKLLEPYFDLVEIRGT